MGIRWRQLLLAVLLSAFGFQTWLVYADSSGRETPPLSPEAERGWQLWHSHNCQSCHQIFGFGGFLGPDLTNAVESLTQARVESALTVGVGQMPAFHLEGDERSAVWQFLREVSSTGTGQARAPRGGTPQEAFAAVVSGASASAEDWSPTIAAGWDLVSSQRCIDCHLPNTTSRFRGTDLSTVSRKLGKDGLLAIVQAGIPAKGMPAFRLTEPEGDALFDFLSWLDGHGETLRTVFARANLSGELTFEDLPWFEYD